MVAKVTIQLAVTSKCFSKKLRDFQTEALGAVAQKRWSLYSVPPPAAVDALSSFRKKKKNKHQVDTGPNET